MIETIIAIDLENEENQVIDQIKLDEPIEFNPNNLSIPNFCVCNSYSQDNGNVLRLQFESEDKDYDQFDIEETLQEIMDNIMFESDTDELFNDSMIDQLHNALSLIMLIN